MIVRARCNADWLFGFGGLSVAASIPEYMTMVAAGLAGTTPHMISATITAISRLVFEFKGASLPSFCLMPRCC